MIYNIQRVIKPVKHNALKKASPSDYDFTIQDNNTAVPSKYFLNFYVPGVNLLRPYDN